MALRHKVQEPAQILRAATVNCADLFGMQGLIGKVRPTSIGLPWHNFQGMNEYRIASTATDADASPIKKSIRYDSAIVSYSFDLWQTWQVCIRSIRIPSSLPCIEKRG